MRLKISSRDFEICFGFNRKIAIWITPLIARTPLRPNHVTTLALVSGLLSGFFMSKGTRLAMLEGAAFLHLYFILDNCDGELARLKSMQSRLGKWYDLVSDLFVDCVLWVSLGLGAFAQGASAFVFVLSAVACAGSAMNFKRVLIERAQGGDVFKLDNKNPWSSLMDSLRYDGDPSFLVWIIAAIGHPIYLLVAGFLYIHFIWIYSIVVLKARKKSLTGREIRQVKAAAQCP